ncbi:signal peptidase I [Blastococcus sp. CCUG 61487]|uniref:signal peptidase I n=1 Tax=Blastococcus sp. CCUG 61487 TaxID=1840703 RepID=UPI0010C03BB0|nr:signal peptidase I [Blastococcus sp. CCUG 61487]TKJ33246.1 S26 family signal peptidase [Blastococcus sp. CCUG 61487]
MSSERPGGPADVVPGEPDPQGSGSDAGPPTEQQNASSGRARRRRGGAAKKGSLLRELPVLLVVAFVLALVVKTFFVQAFFIPSGSMEQTLHGCPGCTGDRVLVNKVPYWFGEPEPGDVVVFKGPDTWNAEVTVEEPGNWFTAGMLWLGRTVGVAPPSEDDFVKRVIAVGGQTVECCDVEGRVTVDGEPLDEPYIFENTPIEFRTFGPVRVPEGRLWVMGDHRSASSDSKAHIGDEYFGTVAVDDVIGKAAVIVWPVSRFGFIVSPDIQSTQAAAVGLETGTAGVRPDLVASSAVGLLGAVPVVAWRRRRRRRR